MSPTVGERDLIREFTDACREQDILPGLYFTPTDPYTVNVLGHPQGSAANEAVQLAQMRELTTNYGDVAYIWFDHYCQIAGKQHPEWVCPLHQTFAHLAEIVRGNQPGAVILGQDTKQVGGESGFSPYPMYYRCDTRLGTNISNCMDSQSGRSKTGQVGRIRISEASSSVIRVFGPDSQNDGVNGSPFGKVN